MEAPLLVRVEDITYDRTGIPKATLQNLVAGYQYSVFLVEVRDLLGLLLLLKDKVCH
jgi:hypothetical protein